MDRPKIFRAFYEDSETGEMVPQYGFRVSEFERNPVELDDADQARLVMEVSWRLDRQQPGDKATPTEQLMAAGVDTLEKLLDFHQRVQEFEDAGIRWDPVWPLAIGDGVLPLGVEEAFDRSMLGPHYPVLIPREQRARWVEAAYTVAKAAVDPDLLTALRLPEINAPAAVELDYASCLDYAASLGWSPENFRALAECVPRRRFEWFI